MAEWEAPPAFDEYVRSRHAHLLRFAHVLTGDPHLAADLVQDALERAGLRWRRIQRQDDPEAYLRRIVVNAFLNHQRRRRREQLVAEPKDQPDPASPQPDDGELWQLLATLPAQQRAVLVLRYYEDLSEAQIADVLGCALGTVKSNASRAMAKLRTALGKPLESTEEGVR